MYHAIALWMLSWLFVSVTLPENRGYINDLTGTLSKDTLLYYDEQLRSFEAMEGVQLIVIILPDLGGSSVEDMAQRIAGEWQVGHKGRDSGILFILAKKEHKAYIDLGYALESNITESQAQGIVQKQVEPQLARGHVEKALDIGLAQIFVLFGKSMGSGGVTNVGSFWHMTSLLIFLLCIPLLYFTARLAASKYVWVSPTLGFIAGLTQSIGLAVVLGFMGGLMVLITYLVRTYAKPRGQ